MAAATAAAFVLAPFLGRADAFWMMARKYCLHMARVWGVRTELQGWEALPGDLQEGRQPAIFIANHTSNVDPVLLVCHLTCRPVFVAKLEVAFVPVLGAVTWLSGAIFINRRNREKAIASMKRAAQKIRNGANVMAFPEGTRSRDGVLTFPFKKGVFNMAMQAEVPVVPLGLVGAYAILPPGSWRPVPGPFTIRVGRPLYPADFPDAEALRLAAEASMEALVKG
jgi:1-acyl-sn-glycerol-3-phosphate acyltransferase